MRLADILFPRGAVCIVCGKPADGGALCSRCQARLDQAMLADPPRQDVYIEEITSAWLYRDEARSLVHRLKFGTVEDAADPLACGMIAAARRMHLPPDTVVTSVPMPVMRRKSRGIDHGMTLAIRVATGLGLRYRPLMRRRSQSRTQRGLSRGRRLTNLQGALICEPLHGEHILLIDDVLTTGATAQACAQALREAGAGSVRVVTAARVPARGR